VIGPGVSLAATARSRAAKPRWVSSSSAARRWRWLAAAAAGHRWRGREPAFRAPDRGRAPPCRRPRTVVSLPRGLETPVEGGDCPQGRQLPAQGPRPRSRSHRRHNQRVKINSPSGGQDSRAGSAQDPAAGDTSDRYRADGWSRGRSPGSTAAAAPSATTTSLRPPRRDGPMGPGHRQDQTTRPTPSRPIAQFNGHSYSWPGRRGALDRNDGFSTYCDRD
jgi:hypothetical protein